MKEAVKDRAPVSMDALVQQTESPFMVGVLHFPLPAKFRMPQIEAFDGTKDPVDHLNTYTTRMELHGYQGPMCLTFYDATPPPLSRRVVVLFSWEVNDFLPKRKGKVALCLRVMTCSSL